MYILFVVHLNRFAATKKRRRHLCNVAVFMLPPSLRVHSWPLFLSGYIWVCSALSGTSPPKKSMRPKRCAMRLLVKNGRQNWPAILLLRHNCCPNTSIFSLHLLLDLSYPSSLFLPLLSVPPLSPSHLSGWHYVNRSSSTCGSSKDESFYILLPTHAFKTFK